MNLEDLFGMESSGEVFHYQEPDIFLPLLKESLLTLDEPDNRTPNQVIFRASSLGSCGRAILYKLRGEKHTKTFNEVFTLELGTSIHKIIQKATSSLSEGISSEETIVVEELDTQGHYDYLLKINAKKYVLEIKSCHVEAFQNLILRPDAYKKHKKQAHVYMKGLGAEETLFIYVNKNTRLTKDFSEEHPNANPLFLEIRVPWNEKIWEELLEETKELKSHIIQNTLPKYKKVTECSWCQFIDMCKKDNELEKTERRKNKKLK